MKDYTYLIYFFIYIMIIMIVLNFLNDIIQEGNYKLKWITRFIKIISLIIIFYFLVMFLIKNYLNFDFFKIWYLYVSKVICKTGDELYSTYGQSVDRILKDIMGLKTTRNIAIENKINELRKMIDENEYNSEEFKIKFNNLKEILGNSDEDIFLMEIDIKSKEKK